MAYLGSRNLDMDNNENNMHILYEVEKSTKPSLLPKVVRVWKINHLS